MKHLIVLIASLIFVALSSANSVWGININVLGNGSGSQNTVNYNYTTDKSSNQSNSSTFKNNFPVNCQTGDNSVNGNTGNGGTINSGDCSANIQYDNQANTNNATLKCPTCGVGGPEPQNPPSPSNPSNPGISSSSSGSSSQGGSVDGAAAGNPQILAATGEKEASILGLTGLFSLSIGAWQLRKNALGLPVKRNF